MKNILNHFAKLKKINIAFPQATDPTKKQLANKLAAKITFQSPEKVSLDEAWNIVVTWVNVAGLSLIKKEDTYQIVDVSVANQEALPIYIDLPVDIIPDTNERVRYLYYFKNINIKNAQKNLDPILKGMLDDKESKAIIIEPYVEKNYCKTCNKMILPEFFINEKGKKFKTCESCRIKDKKFQKNYKCEHNGKKSECKSCRASSGIFKKYRRRVYDSFQQSHGSGQIFN